jgi:ADP-ribose pyrophosphatase YjhB (NUDIX family)
VTYDTSPQVLTWAVHRVGQGILVDGDRVLLTGNRWFADRPLVWTLPGGRAEEGEGMAAALVREFREETGLDVGVLDLAYVAESRSVVRRQLFMVCAFAVRALGGTLSCEADPGVEELRYVPFGELGKYLSAPSLGDPLRWYVGNPGGAARYWFFGEYSTE